jgi:sterol desaturase/sphingolipid hydroxylase (fatty acid hydroxylase superfamily)
MGADASAREPNMDLVPYAVPFFLLLIGIEYVWGRLHGSDTYRLNDSVNSLSLGVLSTAIKIVGLNFGGAVFSWVEQHLALTRLDMHSAWNWIFALLLYDLCYYWFHRISHERTLFWASHVAHHQSEEYNLTTALRQTSTGFLVSWLFYIPCFIAGVPATMFVTVASVHLIYQFWIHTRHIPKLGVLEWFLITASNHRVHHAQNARYVDKNYGGLLIVWDRLFGTFEEERADEPPVYGILGPLRSWNPLWANLHVYVQMLRDAWYTHAVADKLRVLGARTGWRPADVAQRFPLAKGRLEDFRRYDPPLTRPVAAYTLAQFVFLLGYALWMEQRAPAQGLMLRLALFGYLLLGLIALGALMQCAMTGRRWEQLRLALTAGAVALLYLTQSSPVWVNSLMIAYVLASLVVMRRMVPVAESI